MLEQIKNTVVFLEGTYVKQETRLVNGVQQQIQTNTPMSGTGFLIFLPEPRFAKTNQGFTFLVTNRHMIREPGPTGTLGEGPYFTDLVMRMNTLKASADGSQFATFPLIVVDGTGSLLWFVDTDEFVDLAITPANLSGHGLDFKTIQSELFATKEVLAKEKVNENDEILFTGLFTWSPGTKKNLPIVRHGKLARLLEEPIPIDRAHPERTVEVHLAEVMSFGGNSGSPVFLRLGGMQEEPFVVRGYTYYLLGVMQGFFPEGMDFAIQVAELRGLAAQNSGLAAVIPCDKINKILSSARAQAFRDVMVANSWVADGKFTEAEPLYKTAIQTLNEAAPQHTDLANALQGYALLLRKMNRIKEAVLLEARASQIRSNISLDRMKPRF